MNFLDEYKRLAEAETDNEFPEHMEHDGLSESDRDMYEEVLNKMRADMDKANEDMRKNSGSWGDVCEPVNGTIQNKTYKINTDKLMNQMNKESLQNVVNSADGNMKPVSEPIGWFVEGFRCPKCGRLMYESENSFDCPGCGYGENSDGRHMQFYFVEKTYDMIPLCRDDNRGMCEIFRRASQNK